MDASRIHWYDRTPEDVVRGGLSRASEANVGGWDGYYAQVAIDEGVRTVVTIDDDFERFDAFETEVILTTEGFERLKSVSRDQHVSGRNSHASTLRT